MFSTLSTSTTSLHNLRSIIDQLVSKDTSINYITSWGVGFPWSSRHLFRVVLGSCLISDILGSCLICINDTGPHRTTMLAVSVSLCFIVFHSVSIAVCMCSLCDLPIASKNQDTTTRRHRLWGPFGRMDERWREHLKICWCSLETKTTVINFLDVDSAAWGKFLSTVCS